MSDLKIKVFTGNEITPYTHEISRLCASHFCKFPYLYGSDNSRESLDFIDFEDFPGQRESMMVTGFDEKRLFGIATGMPLKDVDYIPDFRDLFAANGYDVNDFYYYCDVIVEETYRGKVPYYEILKLMEKQAKSWGYSKICFITAFRPKDHALRPKEYRELDPLFKRFGYNKTDMKVAMTYPTLQENGDIRLASNEMSFWVKEL